MKKITVFLIWTVLLSALILMSTLLYWLLRPYKIADFKNLPFPVLNENKIVKRGETVLYRMEYCKYTSQIPSVRKFLLNGVIFEITNTVGVATKGCKTTIAEAHISPNIPKGNYFIKIIARYQVNPIRSMDIINYTENFTVE